MSPPLSFLLLSPSTHPFELPLSLHKPLLSSRFPFSFLIHGIPPFQGKKSTTPKAGPPPWAA